MENLFICYSPCNSCSKAKKYLKGKEIDFIERDIVKETPTKQELKEWVEASDLPIKRFFNTSGKVYRDLNLKDKLESMTFDEKIELLSKNGMLIKRPLLITADRVLVGFKEAEYDEALQ